VEAGNGALARTLVLVISAVALLILFVANRLNPSHLTTGITIVGKRAVLPRGIRIGRNVRVDADVRTMDFPGRVVESGETVERHGTRPRSRAKTAASEKG
jgi:hypothetical protein